MLTGFLRPLRWLACAALLAAGSVLPASAQEGPKLYVFTSGSLGGFPKAALQIGGQGNIDWIPVGFYIIKHPKGVVMFDTGNNDKTITDAEGWWGPLAKGFGLKMTKDDAIPVQLAKIGLKPEDVKYVITGHLHLDHGGNVGLFKNSTLIAQDDEFKAAWWPDVGYSIYYIPGDFAETKNMKTIRLNGDLDLFDDGSVRVMRGPGHTPGSQFLVVKLPKTGTAILTSDCVYMVESLDKNLIPPIPGTWSPGDTYKTYARIRQIRDADNAKMFIAHDAEVFKAAKKAPEFYD
jgi:glyoxylase-like metal-dependent hydrolase (beta-lactamase superfamily II)